MGKNWKIMLKRLLDEFERENSPKSIVDKQKAYAELRCVFDESVLASQSRQAEIDYGKHIEGINGIEGRDISKIQLMKK